MPDQISLNTINDWMLHTIDHAWQGVARGQSPFAAAVYDVDGTRLSLAYNTVTQASEPSRHGEVNAIDAACRHTGSAKLDGVWLVSTGEPCPMCAAIALMAGIEHVVFGASHKTIAEAGYETLGLPIADFVTASAKKLKVIGGVHEEACDRLLMQNPKPS